MVHSKQDDCAECRISVLSRVHTESSAETRRKTTHEAVRSLACCKRMLMYAKYMQENG